MKKIKIGKTLGAAKTLAGAVITTEAAKNAELKDMEDLDKNFEKTITNNKLNTKFTV
jgi:ABC-type glycerol-3-phosphate transport system substrate-binding protein